MLKLNRHLKNIFIFNFSRNIRKSPRTRLRNKEVTANESIVEENPESVFEAPMIEDQPIDIESEQSLFDQVRSMETSNQHQLLAKTIKT